MCSEGVKGLGVLRVVDVTQGVLFVELWIIFRSLELVFRDLSTGFSS